ncbi:MAG: ATP-binding protein, partial [Bacteroidota bacterium]
FIKAGKFRTAIIVMPQEHLKEQFTKGMGTFEYMRELLLGFPSIPLQYPFVILGINDVKQNLQITNLNSQIDVFLIKKLGLTLSEVLIEGEAQAYDFKEELPNNGKTAQEVCGFANQEDGGMLLIGIADDGSIPGIDPGEWDSIQTRLASIISSSVSPAPVFAIHRFEVPEDSERIIVILEISESSHKPCMTRDRVYVRKSASVRPATTEDIRRMLIR